MNEGVVRENLSAIGRQSMDLTECNRNCVTKCFRLQAVLANLHDFVERVVDRQRQVHDLPSTNLIKQHVLLCVDLKPLAMHVPRPHCVMIAVLKKPTKRSSCPGSSLLLFSQPNSYTHAHRNLRKDIQKLVNGGNVVRPLCEPVCKQS